MMKLYFSSSFFASSIKVQCPGSKMPSSCLLNRKFTSQSHLWLPSNHEVFLSQTIIKNSKKPSCTTTERYYKNENRNKDTYDGKRHKRPRILNCISVLIGPKLYNRSEGPKQLTGRCPCPGSRTCSCRRPRKQVQEQGLPLSPKHLHQRIQHPSE